ncbi:MAG: RebB family R body protein, partial [Devosiaceae bacterium]|nr:RebB family R body protein [Devosiaceae bacterium MH13]
MRVRNGVLAACIFSVPSVGWSEFPEPVNPHVTDSVTQANVKILGDAPAVAMG